MSHPDLDRLVKALKIHKDHSQVTLPDPVPSEKKPDEVPAKKKRGRKRKYPRPEDQANQVSSSEEEDNMDNYLNDTL